MEERERHDFLSAAARSALMSQIGARNTRPEVMVRSLLHSAGFRFRLHEKRLPGRPDIVLPRYHTVVFVHGCFWHGHSCPKGTSLPKTRAEFWVSKITRTKERDAENKADLEKLGWRVVVVWGCELKEPSLLVERLKKEIWS
ncbi:MAG: very short patch repair endonuclease [Thermodesulfobacteriota bacterium]